MIDRIKSEGILRYGKTSRLVVDVDKDLAKYYRTFIPKHISFNVPMHSPHITVIRTGHEKPLDMERWGEREGEVIEFKYDPEINIGQTYIWLSVHCKKLELIREELGLDACFDKFKWFHITIANMK